MFVLGLLGGTEEGGRKERGNSLLEAARGDAPSQMAKYWMSGHAKMRKVWYCRQFSASWGEG